VPERHLGAVPAGPALSAPGAIEAFFREIDARWTARHVTRIRLPIIGSAALLLQTDYERGTKDGDVLRTPSLSADAQEQLLALAGRGTRL
jgi:hypothetical protein